MAAPMPAAAGAPGSDALKNKPEGRTQGPPPNMAPSQRPNPGLQNVAAAAESSGILNKRKLQELLNQISPGDRLDPDVEEVLTEIAEDFVDNVTHFGCLLAKHRKSTVLEAKDLRFHLEKNWGIHVPGFAAAEVKKPAPAAAPAAPPGDVTVAASLCT